jgi:ATP-binding protein involved in chromosome partitioning
LRSKLKNVFDKIKILQALGSVMDPTSGRSIVAVNMVQDLDIQGVNVNFSLILPSLGIPNKQDLIFACVSEIQDMFPTAEVNIHTKTVNTDMPSEEKVLPQVKNIIAIASGKGGVGKSTVSSNLALGLAKMGAKVGLLDADLYGPSIPTMFGVQKLRPLVQDVYGQPKIVPLEAHGIHLISLGNLVEPEQAVVLRGPRLAGIIKQFLNDTLWPTLDYLLIDLPPGTGDIQLTLVQTVPLTGVVMVTTPQEVALIDAVKAMNMFQLPQVNVPILGVIENMSWFTPEELPNNKYYIFGEGGGKKLAKMANSVLMGQIPMVQGIRESGDSGTPAIGGDNPIVKEAFQTAIENLVNQIQLRHEVLAPTTKVHVQ